MKENLSVPNNMIGMNKAIIAKWCMYGTLFLISFYIILVFPSRPRKLDYGSAPWTNFKLVGKSLKDNHYEVISLVHSEESYSDEMKYSDGYDGPMTNDILKEYSFAVSNNNVKRIVKDINAPKNVYTLKIKNTNNITHVILRESQNTTYWYYYDIENGIPGNFHLGTIGLAWPAISLVLSFFWMTVLFLSIQIIRAIYRRVSGLREKAT